MAGNFEAVRKEVTAEFLTEFSNNCVMAKLLKRSFEKYFTGPVKIGSSLDIKTAIRTIGADGQAFQPEGLERVTVPLSVNYWLQESFVFNDTEEAMFLSEDMKKNYIRPHAINLANKWDRYMLQYMQAIVPNWVGTPGTIPTSATQGLVPTAYQSAQTKLDQLLADGDNRYIVYNAAYNQQVIQSLSTIFNPTDAISKAFKKGYLGEYADFDFYKDEQVPSFTVGTYAGTPVVNGANQTGDTIAVNGYTPGSLSVSQGIGVDRITFAGCYEINYQSRLPVPGVLKQFSIISPATDTAGAVTFQIFPAIIPSGPYQNCSAPPTSGGAATIIGASGTLAQTAFAFQEDAFTWVSIPLQNVDEFGAKCDVMSDPETGLNIRSVWQWDNRMGEVTVRMDFVGGIASTESDRKSAVIFG